MSNYHKDLENEKATCALCKGFGAIVGVTRDYEGGLRGTPWTLWKAATWAAKQGKIYRVDCPDCA